MSIVVAAGTHADRHEEDGADGPLTDYALISQNAVNALQQGCKGDGTVDDLSALQDAADYAASLNTFSVVAQEDGTTHPVRPTLYVPPGLYKLNDTFVLPQGVSLLLDQGAILRAGASMDYLVDTTSDPMEGADFVRGGTFDCNSLAGTGLRARLVRHASFLDLNVINSLGKGVVMGDSGLPVASFEAILNNVRIWRGPTFVGSAGDIGLHMAYCSDSEISNVICAGYDIGVKSSRGSNTFSHCHAWGFIGVSDPSISFYDETSNCTWEKCYADGPTQTGFYFALGNSRLADSQVILVSSSPDNTVDAVTIASGGGMTVTNCTFHGIDSSHRLKSDFNGDISTSTILGCRHDFTVSPQLDVYGNSFPTAGVIGGAPITIQKTFLGSLGSFPVGSFIAPVKMRVTRVTAFRNSGSGTTTFQIEKAGVSQAGPFNVGTPGTCNFVMAQDDSVYVHVTTLGSSSDVHVAISGYAIP